jgi:xanthine dehydrogenase accessory factor
MKELFLKLSELTQEGKPFVLATVIDSSGSTPQKPGSKMVVTEGGPHFGTVGGGAIELQVVEAARALLGDPSANSKLLETHLTHDLGMCCGGKMRVFLEKYGASPHLWVFGAGHVGKELAALGHQLGFHVHVVDARPGLLNRQRFPKTEIQVADPADVARKLTGNLDSYFCVVTHDHALDQECVEALLRKPCAYLGVIGSRRKAERFKMRLRAAGFSDEELTKMVSPMGVAIHALTPQEIAVSIVAELVSIRRRDSQKKAP